MIRGLKTRFVLVPFLNPPLLSPHGLQAYREKLANGLITVSTCIIVGCWLLHLHCTTLTVPIEVTDKVAIWLRVCFSSFINSLLQPPHSPVCQWLSLEVLHLCPPGKGSLLAEQFCPFPVTSPSDIVKRVCSNLEPWNVQNCARTAEEYNYSHHICCSFLLALSSTPQTKAHLIYYIRT